MKILLYSDNHFSTYSSILRGRGSLFSTRLENQIDSINWAHKYAFDNNMPVICLGDFFDSCQLTSEEITALNYIPHYDIPITFLVGNHEISRGDRAFSSSQVFNLSNNTLVVQEPCKYDVGDTEMCFLPYIVEANRKSLSDYFGPKKGKRIILSHNDIAGCQMGKFISKIGFSISEIESCCDLFINGHLHNGNYVTDKILNIGNLTGQNFSEDASKYEHHVAVLDTDTLRVTFIENPYALNFYKINFSDKLPVLKSNSVLTIKAKINQADQVKSYLENPSIICSRVVWEKETISSENKDNHDKLNCLDHLDEFKKYISENMEVTDKSLLYSELENVLG